jgi:mono/diheme cytochrome c family protein
MFKEAVVLLVSLVPLATAVPATLAQQSSAEPLAFFEKDIRPLLVARCLKCHGPKKQEAGLRVDSRAALLAGGENGPAIVPGNPSKGRLLPAVRHQGDVHMPPGGKKLDPAQIAALQRWIEIGAPWPSETVQSLTRSGPITEAERRFWAFQPLAVPPIPEVKGAATPIDRFVLARLHAEGLQPVPAADRRTLLRRVTFDLTGLPPTPAEIEAFLADTSPLAFERVVERLLASPHYGERFGRHWLDVARYADTAGDGADYPVREAYRYRDYVIAAFNADKPFDQFIREQIAGDLLAKQELAHGCTPQRYAELVTATGYLAVGKRFGYNLNDDFQHLDFAEVIESVGRGILGLSLGCARCHDHKYDPVSMEDYYALYGILKGTSFAFPGGEELKRPQRFVPLVPPAMVAAEERARAAGLAALEAESQTLQARRAALVAGWLAALPGSALPAPELQRRLTDLNAELAAIPRRRAEAAERERYPLAYGVSEGTAQNARIQKRGEPDKLGPETPRRFLEILGGDPLPPGAGSGRLELAHWLTRPSNPLTARVIVNRVWQYHFGRGLVATPSDFGSRGARPSHPELLDWLTARFIESGWSIKGLHRLILHSQAYQRASTDAPANRRIDPDNRWLWRNPRRPLDAEAIRDAMLAVSGRLDRSPPGPHPFPAVQTWGFTIHYPFHAVYDHDHRSVYLMVQRARRHPYLALFDGADPNISTAERLPTTTPTQALFLMNAPFVHAQADGFAQRLLAAGGDDASRVRLAFELAHGRLPGADEVRTSLAFLEQYRHRLAGRKLGAEEQTRLAWAAFGRVLLTANAFLYLD